MILSIDLQTIIILMLITLIVGIILGVSLVKPNPQR